MPIAKTAHHTLPGSRVLRSIPGCFSRHLQQGANFLDRPPPGVGPFECHNEADLEAVQPAVKCLVLTVEGIGYHGPERPLRRDSSLNERDRDLGLGPKCRVGLALPEPVGRRVGFNLQWVLDALVSPEAGDRDHAIIGFAQIGQILPADVGGLGAVLAVPTLVNHEHAVRIWCAEGIGT